MGRLHGTRKHASPCHFAGSGHALRVHASRSNGQGIQQLCREAHANHSCAHRLHAAHAWAAAARLGREVRQAVSRGAAQRRRSAHALAGSALHGLAALRHWVERPRAGSRADLAKAGRLVHFERTGPKLLLVEPNDAFRTSFARPGRTACGAADRFLSPCCGASRSKPRAPIGTVLVDATDFFLRDAHDVARGAGARETGKLQGRCDSFHDCARPHQGLPEEHRGRGGADFRSRRTNRRGHFVQRCYARPGSDDGARASIVFGAAAAGVHPAPLLSARGILSRRAIATERPAGRFASTSTSSSAIGSSRKIRTARMRARPSRRFSTTSTAARRSRFARRWWKARAGGTRRSRPPAGRPGTFHVDLLPEGADPMDVRYNIIQWVHRYTRGWSYGACDRGPAHRRDHQGQCDARQPARAPGLPHRRGAACAVHIRQVEAESGERRCVADGACSASASLQRMRRDTRSALRTTSRRPAFRIRPRRRCR